MKLDDLIAELIDLRDSTEGEVEVRIAVQPSWPLSHELDAITIDHTHSGKRPAVLWLAASEGHPYGENPYAPKHAWDGGEVYAEEKDDEL